MASLSCPTRARPSAVSAAGCCWQQACCRWCPPSRPRASPPLHREPPRRCLAPCVVSLCLFTPHCACAPPVARRLPTAPPLPAWICPPGQATPAGPALPPEKHFLLHCTHTHTHIREPAHFFSSSPAPLLHTPPPRAATPRFAGCGVGPPGTHARPCTRLPCTTLRPPPFSVSTFPFSRIPFVHARRARGP